MAARPKVFFIIATYKAKGRMKSHWAEKKIVANLQFYTLESFQAWVKKINIFSRKNVHYQQIFIKQNPKNTTQWKVWNEKKERKL